MLLPVLEAVIENVPAFLRSQRVPHPRGIGIAGSGVVEEREELPAAVLLEHSLRVLFPEVLGEVGPAALNHVLRDIHAELGSLGKAMHDVKRERADRGTAAPIIFQDTDLRGFSQI